ncbi:hypothetical protein BDFB_007788 [Asbolus verrucosus]|uniref:Chitin-binding type-2 domain-containing protein n=1 Tax=Asbolus verrucosus TaxID=1661398 RepID=A0A482WAZ2_ASBVE|nr:hypothetical protein BDFB_007788 [Asbolus verrucosus]
MYCSRSLILILVIFLLVDSASSNHNMCLTSGRFRYQDPTCQSYFLCVQVQNSFVKMDYVCPPTAIFNPSTNRCSLHAHCISDICKNLPASVSKIPDPNSNKCQSYIECVGTDQRRPAIRRCSNGYFNKDLPYPGFFWGHIILKMITLVECFKNSIQQLKCAIILRFVLTVSVLDNHLCKYYQTQMQLILAVGERI